MERKVYAKNQFFIKINKKNTRKNIFLREISIYFDLFYHQNIHT